MIYSIPATYEEEIESTVTCSVDMKIFFTLTEASGDGWIEPRQLAQAEFHHVEIDPLVKDPRDIETLTEWAEMYVELNQDECMEEWLREHDRAREYAAENRRDA